MRVFVLEDDEILARIVQDDLSAGGHEVTPWVCVEGAAQAIISDRSDLLVVDIVLPLTSEHRGLEATDGGIRVLKELSDQGINLPTIFASVLDYQINRTKIDDLKLRTFGRGAPPYLRKPYDRGVFLGIVEEIEAVLAIERQEVCGSRVSITEGTDVEPSLVHEDFQKENRVYPRERCRKSESATAGADGHVTLGLRFPQEVPVNLSPREVVGAIERYTAVEFPRKCRIGVVASLKIQLTIKSRLDSSIKQLLEIPLKEMEKEATLSVHVTAPGFRMDTRTMWMRVPFDQDSDLAEFHMTPIAMGRQFIEVELMSQWDRVGYFVVETEVLADAKQRFG